MSEAPMLWVEVSKIPPEGLRIDESLEAGEVHLEGAEDFSLEPGGRLSCQVDRGEDRTVHVQGHLRAELALECNRCLAGFRFPFEQDLELFYLPHERDQEEEEDEDEVDLSDRDMVVSYYQEDRLDLGEMVREQFFLRVPMKRLCREDCLGLCPSCGANRNSTRCACPPEPADPRFAPLSRIFDKSSS